MEWFIATPFFLTYDAFFESEVFLIICFISIKLN